MKTLLPFMLMILLLPTATVANSLSNIWQHSNSSVTANDRQQMQMVYGGQDISVKSRLAQRTVVG